MQQLINDLLAFSRVGRLSTKFTVVDLNALFEDARGNLAAVIEDTQAQVTADQLPSVRGDASLLTAVIQKMVNNAIKFRRPDVTPEVRLSVVEQPSTWQFTCADNGIGIEPEYADRIFVIFQRLHPKDRYPGTGIGLAMCKKIVEYHGGRIWLDADADGAGSTFRFELPKLDEAGTAADTTDADIMGTDTTDTDARATDGSPGVTDRKPVQV